MEFQTGLLGAGFIAPFHVRALSRTSGAHIAWVCDADRKKAEALAAEIPGAKALTSLDVMLARKPDVVHVLLPPEAHAAAAVACLAAGAHVFVEKPLATTSRDALRISASAAAVSKRVGVNHNVLFNETFRKLARAVHARRLGALEHVSVTWNVPLKQLQMGQHGHWMFQTAHNILFEQAVHPLSMVQYLLGDLVDASVLHSGTQSLAGGKTFHQTWQLALELQRGTAQLLLSFGREFTEIGISAIGQDGYATADLRRNTFLLRGNGFREPPLDLLFDGVGEGIGLARQAAATCARTILGTLKVNPPFDPFGDSICESVRAFYDSLARQTESPASISQGVAVVEMCEVLGAAVNEGKELQERRE